MKTLTLKVPMVRSKDPDVTRIEHNFMRRVRSEKAACMAMEAREKGKTGYCVLGGHAFLYNAWAHAI